MANGAQAPAVVDPLVNYWGLSLFPQTSGVPPDPSKPYDPDGDLDSIHNHLRSMALRSPSKLLEQAKSIIDGNPGLFNSEVYGNSASHEINDVVYEEAKENPQERRPALGHKRARFSFKPNKIHPTEILKPSLDIDNLKDPEEFFMAHERLENAKREIQKQMGNVFLEPNQNNTSTSARQRRPGLLGNNQRRSVRYKHRYSTETSDIKENVPSSQETFESGGLDPVGESPEIAEAHLALPRSELCESSAMKENNLNHILDELLHSSEDLEEDQAINLLQESLQIKPIVLEKLSIPDLPNNRVTELKTFGGNLSKPRTPLRNIDNLLPEMNNATPEKIRKDVGNPLQQLALPTPPKSPFALLPSLQKHISQSQPSVDSFSALDCDHLSARNSSDRTNQGLNESRKPSMNMTNLLKEVNNVTPMKLTQDVGSPRQQLASPTPSKSPFALLSLLQKRLSQSKPSIDPLSAIDCDCLSPRNSSQTDITKQGLNLLDSGKPSDKLNESLVKDIKSSVEKTVRNFVSTSGKSREDNSGESGFGTNIDSSKSHVDIEVDTRGRNMGNMVTDDIISRSHSGKCREDNSGESGFGTNIDFSKPHVDIEVDTRGRNMGNMVTDDIISRPHSEANQPSKFKDTVRTCPSASVNFKDNSTEPALGTNVDSNKSHADMEVDVEGSDVGNPFVDDTISRDNYEASEPCKVMEDMIKICVSTSGNTKKDNSTKPVLGPNIDSNVSHVYMEIDVEGSDVGCPNVQDTKIRANGPCEFVDKVQEAGASEQTDDPDLNLNPLDQSNGASREANSVDRITRTSDDGPVQSLQVQENPADSQVPVKEKSKVKSRKRKGEELSRRQSLAVAGTSWESGVRRSTRIRSRPLEFWKGERPVYGRIHESLATVIGVKYMSPGTADGKPKMKVKSYVAEKYKELLELASQH